MAAELSIERLKEIDEQLAVFPLSLLQDFLTFQKYCQKMIIDPDELEQFIKQQVITVAEERRDRVSFLTLLSEKAPRCSVCKSELILQSVNDIPARMIDDHSNSWWICPDPACTFDPVTSDKYPYEVLSDLGIPIHKQLKTPTKPERRSKAAAKQIQSGRGNKRRSK